MKRLLIALVLAVALGATAAAAQTRVSVTIAFGAPLAYHPYYPRYHARPYVVVAPPYYRARPGLIVIGPAPRVYRPARVVVIRERRGRHHRGHW